MKITATQFAWIYLIDHGLSGVTHSYYGGYQAYEKDWDQYSSGPRGSYSSILEPLTLTRIAKSEIIEHGVDWEKTQAPQSDIVSQFEGTFAESSQRETLTGTLYLKNGTQQHWIADAIEVTNVFEMMAKVHSASDEFARVFGT